MIASYVRDVGHGSGRERLRHRYVLALLVINRAPALRTLLRPSSERDDARAQGEDAGLADQARALLELIGGEEARRRAESADNPDGYDPLGSFFRALKRGRLVVRDPARSISLTSSRSVPTALPGDCVAGLLDRFDDPRDLLMVALVAIYALLPGQLARLRRGARRQGGRGG